MDSFGSSSSSSLLSSFAVAGSSWGAALSGREGAAVAAVVGLLSARALFGVAGRSAAVGGRPASSPSSAGG